MKLSKYVEHLQRVLKNEGDLEVVYATDEEGNSFHKVSYAGAIYYFESLEDYFLEQVDVEELDDYPDAVRAFCIN